MSKIIIFKPKFEKKLKELKIKTKFIKNLHSTKKINIKLLNEYKYWGEFITCAFTWKTTLEGHEFWKKIANS